MRYCTPILAGLLLAAGAALTLQAQTTTEVHPGRGGSPHVRSEWAFKGANISITYGRPYLKGRPADQLMPPGKPWRAGADEATTLTTSKPLKFGSLTVPAGTYTLYAVPGSPEWQLIVSKKTGQWGVPYPEGQDLGRVPMSVTAAPTPAEQLSISLNETPTGGNLRISWGTTIATTPFTVG